MTLEELSACIDLIRQQERTRDAIASLRQRSDPAAQVLTGMPRGNGTSDRVEDFTLELLALEEADRLLQKQIDLAAVPIEDYIATISDPLLAMMFRMRFIRGMAWKAVADVLGGGNTEAGVKAACYRWLYQG